MRRGLRIDSFNRECLGAVTAASPGRESCVRLSLRPGLIFTGLLSADTILHMKARTFFWCLLSLSFFACLLAAAWLRRTSTSVPAPLQALSAVSRAADQERTAAASPVAPSAPVAATVPYPLARKNTPTVPARDIIALRSV